jgi:hypothetical protein
VNRQSIDVQKTFLKKKRNILLRKSKKVGGSIENKKESWIQKMDENLRLSFY